MYPGVVDQLNGVKRVLKDIIRPALNSDYEKDMLRWCVRMLNQVAQEAILAHPLHIREAGEIIRLFKRILPDLERHAATARISADLLASVRAAIGEGEGDLVDVAAAEARVGRLRDIAATLTRELAFQEGADATTEAFADYVRALSEMHVAAFRMDTYAWQA